MTEGEGMLLQFFFRDGKFILGPVDKAFLGIPSYLERVADGIKGSHGNHGKVGENPKARAAHDGKLRNGLGRSYGEGVHKGTCIADGCGTGNDGKANDGVISHGNGDAYKNWDKGQGFFGNSNCRGGKADDCHEKGNDEDPHPAADHAQELGNQPVKSTGANDEANEAVGNEEKENDRRRVLHAKVNTLEHFKKTDRMGFDKVIGTGLDNLLARTVGDAVKVASRQDPGHDGCKDNNAKQQDKNMGQGPPGIFLIGGFFRFFRHRSSFLSCNGLLKFFLHGHTVSGVVKHGQDHFRDDGSPFGHLI